MADVLSYVFIGIFFQLGQSLAKACRDDGNQERDHSLLWEERVSTAIGSECPLCQASTAAVAGICYESTYAVLFSSGRFRKTSPPRPSSSCHGLVEETPSASSPASTSVTLQGLEALEWDSRRSRHELQEPGPPLLVEGLHRLPEPPDDVAVSHTVLQPRVGLPVVQVYFIQAAYYQL